MTAFNLLRSVLYEGRAEMQGTFFTLYNDKQEFIDSLKIMFGDYMGDISDLHFPDVSGHWFYSYDEKVTIPSYCSEHDHAFEVDADIVLRLSELTNVYLYHIDENPTKPSRDGGNG